MGMSSCCVSHRSCSSTFALSTHQQGPCSIPLRSRMILNKVTCMRRLPDYPQIPVQSSCATWNCPTNTLLPSSLDALALLLCMLPHARPLHHITSQDTPTSKGLHGILLLSRSPLAIRYAIRNTTAAGARRLASPPYHPHISPPAPDGGRLMWELEARRRYFDTSLSPHIKRRHGSPNSRLDRRDL
jgi:hypothetical protein